VTFIYAESSAVLRWLLGADDNARIHAALVQASVVVSSALTSTEVARTLRRLEAGGALDTRTRESVWLRYSAAVAHWQIHALSEAVLTRASQSFPIEPVRTLDALHLATATLFSFEVAPVELLSVDRRLRENAQALGLGVTPRSV
jgi:PIN domain-containing protein